MADDFSLTQSWLWQLRLVTPALGKQRRDFIRMAPEEQYPRWSSGHTHIHTQTL